MAATCKNSKKERNYNTVSRSTTFGDISQIKPILPLSFVVSGDDLLTFPALPSCVGALVMFSEAHWRSVQVAWLSSPAGIFLLPFPLLHRCLLAYMSCHMFPARPPPEGAKSVFVHNLHRLTRPTLTGTHGVYGEQQKHYSAIFSLLFLLLLPSSRRITFLSVCPDIYTFPVLDQDDKLYSCT